MDFSYRALARVAELKTLYPEHVHTLLANHETFDADQRRQVIERIDAATARLAGLIDELLTLARLEAGGTALVAVGDSTSEVLAAAQASAAELPDGTVAMHLEEWVGGLLRGYWARRRCDRNQLPAIPGARKRPGRKAEAAR